MADCYKCQYRSRVTLTCDYYLVTNQLRGCSVEACDKFVEREGKFIDKNILKIEKLYYKGFSDRAISEQLGVSRYVVYTWRKTMALPINKENTGKPKGGKK